MGDQNDICENRGYYTKSKRTKTVKRLSKYNDSSRKKGKNEYETLCSVVFEINK